MSNEISATTTNYKKTCSVNFIFFFRAGKTLKSQWAKFLNSALNLIIDKRRHADVI